MEQTTRSSLQSGKVDVLVAEIKGYIDHEAPRLAIEYNRLFMMADIILQDKADQVSRDYVQCEGAKMGDLGKLGVIMKNR